VNSADHENLLSAMRSAGASNMQLRKKDAEIAALRAQVQHLGSLCDELEHNGALQRKSSGQLIHDLGQDRKRLRAQVQEAKEIMEEIQWSHDPNDEYGRWCMACGASTGLGSKRKPKKHHEGCRLAKFLKDTE